MNKYIKLSILIAVLLTFLCIPNSNAQDDDCNKTKVAVSLEIVDDTDNFDWLENDFGPRPKSKWNSFTANMLVQILSEYEPDITFFTLGEGSGDYHYHFKAGLDLTIVGKDDDKETGYWVTASLIANANCIPNRNWVLDAEATYGKDRELKQAMKNLVAQFSPMDRSIISYEKDHPSAPRDPQLNMEIIKDYISPLDIESRKTKVNAKVYDCRGNLVCDKRGNGQPVYYEDEIDRLDLKIGHCEGGYHIGKFMVIITYKDCNNEGEYKLEKGIEAEKKNIRFKTCQLGGGLEAYIIEEKELIIRGLEIKVKPDRKQLEAGQRTKIVITFNETDPDGSKYPVEGKELDVKITGLENGTIKPKNGYTTNNEGQVILDYKAGDNDERIRVTASFQPEDYPDKAEGKGMVTVKPADYDASITVTKKFEKILETSNEDRKEEHIQKHRLNESIEATVTVYAKLTDVQEMPVFNQTWEYYKPVSVNITSFNYNSTENKFRSGPNYQTTVNYFRSVNNFEIEELNSVSQVPWMLAIDNETGKAVKIIPGGYDIAYDFIETETVKNVKTSEQGTEIDSNSSTKNSEKTFALGPVGEEVEDPTIKMSDTWIQDYIKKQGIALPPGVEIPEISNQETIKKIKPDILVKSGDGKYNFGGYGKRTIKEDLWNGYQEENLNYKWSMTRIKK